jgi:hypothetical protein
MTSLGLKPATFFTGAQCLKYFYSCPHPPPVADMASKSWCNITILNVHTLAEDEIDDVKDSFYVELECVFNKFLNYFEISLWS